MRISEPVIITPRDKYLKSHVPQEPVSIPERGEGSDTARPTVLILISIPINLSIP